MVFRLLWWENELTGHPALAREQEEERHSILGEDAEEDHSFVSLIKGEEEDHCIHSMRERTREDNQSIHSTRGGGTIPFIL